VLNFVQKIRDLALTFQILEEEARPIFRLVDALQIVVVVNPGKGDP
jgi:hypothetical protein